MELSPIETQLLQFIEVLEKEYSQPVELERIHLYSFVYDCRTETPLWDDWVKNGGGPVSPSLTQTLSSLVDNGFLVEKTQTGPANQYCFAISQDGQLYLRQQSIANTEYMQTIVEASVFETLHHILP